MNVYPNFPVQRRFERLPEDSGEWRAVPLRYRTLRRPSSGIGRWRSAAAIAAGVIVWPLPVLVFTFYSLSSDLVVASVLFPAHVGATMALVAGRHATIEKCTGLVFRTCIAVGAFVGVVAGAVALATGGIGQFILTTLLILVVVIGSIPGALIGAWLAKFAIARLSNGSAKPNQQAGRRPAFHKHHAGAVPYTSPRTQRRPRHG